MSIGESTTSQPVDRVCTVLAAAGIMVLAIRRWMLVGSFPPGLDGAQWLALGRGLDGQAVGRSTDGAYAPLVPLLATIAESIAGPLLAVRILAAASGLAVTLAVWFVARGALGPVWGFVFTAIVIPASTLAEPMLFGGYPQQFSLAAGIVALWAVCHYLVRSSSDEQSEPPEAPQAQRVDFSPSSTGKGSAVREYRGDTKWSPKFRMTGNLKALGLASTAALIAATAHHVYFPVIALAILAAVGLWSGVRSPKSDPARTIGSLALALTPAVAIFATVALTFVRAGYAAPLDASTRSFVDAWEYGTRESPELWLVILAIGAAGLAIRRGMRGGSGWLFAASLLVPTGLLFLLTGQPRLLPLILISAGIAAGLCASWVASIGPRIHAAALFLALAIATTLVVPADQATSRFADFYRVVDESLMGAAAAIESDSSSGAVAVRKDRRGWPVGWWFEALLDRPVIVGSDPQWLAFPEEREHARQAESLFDGGLDAETFQKRAMASGVGYLVVAKWDWIGWERWVNTPGFPIAEIYDDERYLVLRIT